MKTGPNIKHVIPGLALTFLILMGGLILPQLAEAQTLSNPVNQFRIGTYLLTGSDPLNWTQTATTWIVTTILQFVGLLTAMGGLLLNGAVFHTVVEMKSNYDKITGIGEAWKVIRDVANMSFIFILLYSAIRTILGVGEDNKKLIVNIVIVAILINFSLFFTKIIIDASNLLALTFYDAMVPGAAARGLGGAGLSNAFMDALNIQSLYELGAKGTVTPGSIITVGLMGSIMLLITAFIFFAVAIMFVIRYVVLIIVLVLSPLAFVTQILPKGAGLSKYNDKWWDALLGQAFFAPVYFMMTWITLRILGGITSALDGGKLGDIARVGMATDVTSVNGWNGFFESFLNFAIVIVFLIASIVLAKEWANKASEAKGLTKWAMGMAGGATLGAAGWAGRNTVGRGMQAIGESEYLKRTRASMVEKGGLYGAIGGAGVRLAQARAKKVGASSFDIRGTGLGGTLDAGKAQKGGYEADRKAANKQAEEYAKSQEPSDKAKAKAKIEYESAVARHGVDSPQADAARRRRDLILGNKDDIEKRTANVEDKKKKDIEKIKNSEELRAAELAERSAQDTVTKLEAEAKAAIGTAEEDRRKAEVVAAKETLKIAQETARGIRKENKEKIDEISEVHEEAKRDIKAQEVKPAGERRKAAEATSVENSKWAKFRGYNYTAAAQIRKGKSAKDKAADILKDLAKDGTIPSEEKPPEPPAAAPTP